MIFPYITFTCCTILKGGQDSGSRFGESSNKSKISTSVETSLNGLESLRNRVTVTSKSFHETESVRNKAIPRSESKSHGLESARNKVILTTESRYNDSESARNKVTPLSESRSCRPESGRNKVKTQISSESVGIFAASETIADKVSLENGLTSGQISPILVRKKAKPPDIQLLQLNR